MQILFDIGHPAHVHFFRNPIRQLTGKGHKILVTSRDKEVTHQLLDSLSIPHISLTSQADGSAALLFRELLVRDYRLYRKVRESGQPFDAVILDLTVPGGMGGAETVKKLLEIDPEAKVIVSSGYATDPIMSEYKKYGFSAVVAKPYNVGQMEKTLHDVLAGKK